MNNDSYCTLIGGDYAIDYLVLSKLPINDIVLLSNYGEYFSPICADNYFWYIVANYHFPGVVPTTGTTWFQLIEFLTSDKANSVNNGLELSAQAGNHSLVEYFIGKGADHWNWGMQEAAHGGHKYLIEFFISKGANNWNFGMYGAALGGHENLIEFFISKGANNWNWAMLGAEVEGHQNLVEYFRQKNKI